MEHDSWLMSCGRHDEVYVVRDLGILVRIRELIEHLNAFPDVGDRGWSATAWLLGLRRSDAVKDVSWVSPERREEPVLIAVLDEHGPRVIDGNHRLVSRAFHQLDETRVVGVPPDVLAPFVSDLGF